MTTNLGKTVRIKDGKVQRIHRLSASKRKGAHVKASRQAKAWGKKSK